MQPLFLVVGIVLLIAVIVDLFWTTLWVDGGSGPLSGRLTTGVWRGLRFVARERSRALSVAGPLILACTLVMWIGLLWLGWAFLFAGGSTALVNTHTGDPATWPGRLYYVAYTMFTSGNGDYAPTSATWELVSAATTATGMAFVTLAVSYVLSVLGAVSEKRSFASDVTGLGDRSESFVRTGWTGNSPDGSGRGGSTGPSGPPGAVTDGGTNTDAHPHPNAADPFAGLDLPLESLATQLSLLAEQHKSYPILHYYHSEQSAQASAVAVPILDESLTIARHGIPDDQQPNPTLVADARSSVDGYLETLEAAFIEPAAQAPPAPELDRLREDDIPTVADEEFEAALEEHAERRRKLLGVVRADAWEWPPVDD
ncbi:potassium channel domain protein [Natrialba magadii ATCC 43099]|uniref:Membrane associated potassium channel n=1 Tax=Natrialba magadii (strain ATCC 43099 / DSM 3394 / CCM 3739 / CIP 104546 / IAM 13178 / JCM 8861 / NBRC 102185 / NCIMB 2190 / MS3) TaxID=547559 RepID=D3SV27_NATMM|nr:potassium channel family protein [Natrialba magadii]ADD05435.1 potassium channel domain protein [Natrialba magadii ATCC 43099]ELY29251.1 membrane associated potassium channel [Natrialba magadii ATCC 43099]